MGSEIVIAILKIEYKSGSEYIKQGIQLPAKSKIKWSVCDNDMPFLSR